MRFKRVLRYDPGCRLLRLFRVMWTRGTVGDGRGYSSKLSVGLTPRFLRFRREYGGWFLTLLGVRVHYDRSYGGVHG